MSASDLPVFELALPRRPSLDDVGGATLVDDIENGIPDKSRMPYAAQLNQLQWMAAALGRVMPVAVIWYRYVSSVATIHAAQAASSLVTAATFTPTRDGVGNIRIEWPANTFPTPLDEPDVTLTYSLDAGNPTLAANCAPQSLLITNGIRVRTYAQAGTALDYNFRVSLY